MTPSLNERLSAEIGDRIGRLGGLPAPSSGVSVWEELWLADVRHSVPMEGRTLAVRQAGPRIAAGEPVDAGDLGAHLTVEGYASAASWVYAHAASPGGSCPVRIDSVLHVHALAMGPVWAQSPPPSAGPLDAPGLFRRGELAPFHGGMQPAPPQELPDLMAEWVADAREARACPGVRLVDTLADLLARFLRIHPFLDGNGRTGRLLLSLMLLDAGLPPAILFTGDRSLYISALRRADGGWVTPLGELVARAVLASLRRFERVLGCEARNGSAQPVTGEMAALAPHAQPLRSA